MALWGDSVFYWLIILWWVSHQWRWSHCSAWMVSGILKFTHIQRRSGQANGRQINSLEISIYIQLRKSLSCTWLKTRTILKGCIIYICLVFKFFPWQLLLVTVLSKVLGRLVFSRMAVLTRHHSSLKGNAHLSPSDRKERLGCHCNEHSSLARLSLL